MYRLAKNKIVLEKLAIPIAASTPCLAGATTHHHQQYSSLIQARPHVPVPSNVRSIPYVRWNNSSERYNLYRGARGVFCKHNHAIANNCEGWMRDARPAHYTFKIKSFSKIFEILPKCGTQKLESGDFEVGGYKWRLSLYPNGDKNMNVSDHISLYLALSETNDIPLNSEVNAHFKLFVYDQIRDKYLTFEDKSQNGGCFHAMKSECGFSNFMPLSTFLDPTKGYLIGDRCIFGAEVYVRNNTGKGESFSVLTQPQHDFFSYYVIADHISSYLPSQAFTVGGLKWRIHTYPNGKGVHERKSISIFLELVDTDKLGPGQKLFCDFTLRLKDQIHGKHFEQTCVTTFSQIDDFKGFPNFLPLSEVEDKKRGFIKESVFNEWLKVEAKFNSLSEITTF